MAKFPLHSFEPSVRLQWLPVPTQTVWAAVSRAIRASSRIDSDLFQPAPPFLGILYGNPDFKSEKLVAFEIGHRASFGQRFSTSIATFFNNYDDLRSTGVTPDTLLPFVFNNDLGCCASGGTFFYNNKTFSVTYEPPWSQEADVYVHELGHAIGLPHSGWNYYSYDNPWDNMGTNQLPLNSSQCGMYNSKNFGGLSNISIGAS